MNLSTNSSGGTVRVTVRSEISEETYGQPVSIEYGAPSTRPPLRFTEVTGLFTIEGRCTCGTSQNTLIFYFGSEYSEKGTDSKEKERVKITKRFLYLSFD